MLTLMMMNDYDNDIASKFKATIRILFVFGRIVKTPYLLQPHFDLLLDVLCKQIFNVRNVSSAWPTAA